MVTFGKSLTNDGNFFRRPNPIPILAPPDHKKNQGSSASADDSEKNTENEKGTSSVENIDLDNILDNMFVQRQPYEPTISLKDTQAASTMGDDKSDEQLNEGMTVSLSSFRGDFV